MEDVCTCDSTARRGMEEARTHRPLPSGSSCGASIPLLHSPTQVSTETKEEGKEGHQSGSSPPGLPIYESPVQVREGRQAISSLRVIYHKHHHRHPIRSHSSQSRTATGKLTSRRNRNSGEDEREQTINKTVHRERWNPYLSLEVHSVMHVEVLIAIQTEPDDICLGAEHIPLQEQTLICGDFRIISCHSPSKQCRPVKPDSIDTAKH